MTEHEQDQDLQEGQTEQVEDVSEPSEEQEMLKVVQEAEVRCQELEREYTVSKENTSILKKRYDLAVEEMRKLIRQTKEPMPLFDRSNDDGDPDAWRLVTLTAALEGRGVTDNQIAKLHEADLHTLGDVADYTSADRRLEDIDGIGQVISEKIADALTEYWQDHPCEESEEESTTADE